MKVTEAVRIYVEHKRKIGLQYLQPANILISFARQVGDLPLRSVTGQHVSTFLNGPRTSLSTWHQKRGKLLCFFEYWELRGQLDRIPLPPPLPRTEPTFIPFIYTQPQIRLLARSTAAVQWSANCRVSAETLRALLLFLYATGMLLSDALSVRTADVDLKSKLIVVRNTKLHRNRTLPIGRGVHKLLREYLASPASSDDAKRKLFSTKTGLAIDQQVIRTAFQRLREVTNVFRHDGARYQPRVDDLRHTFAVHRLTAWCREGKNVQNMLPALAAYMGQVGLGSTERYLALTPERFRKQLSHLSPGFAKIAKSPARPFAAA